MKLIRPLFDTPCWRINADTQLGLDLSFGSPYLEIREPWESKSKEKSVRDLLARRSACVKASCWLWIQSARWAITLADGHHVNWSSSAKKRGIAFALLEGEKVVRVVIEPETGLTTFFFDLGGALKAERFRRVADDTLWTLYKPNGYCFSVRSDGQYCHAPCSESKEAWCPVR
jgi:hypothetical protein